MTDAILLKGIIDDSGITISHIAEKMGCSRNRVYAIIGGSECTASEIVILSDILHLTKAQRDSIFLNKKVSDTHAEG